jgi:hypothetical protein
MLRLGSVGPVECMSGMVGTYNPCSFVITGSYRSVVIIFEDGCKRPSIIDLNTLRISSPTEKEVKMTVRNLEWSTEQPKHLPSDGRKPLKNVLNSHTAYSF